MVNSREVVSPALEMESDVRSRSNGEMLHGEVYMYRVMTSKVSLPKYTYMYMYREILIKKVKMSILTKFVGKLYT